MGMASTRTPKILGIDAGGTLTDAFLIDQHGEFIIGKAQTTPEDESIGLMTSCRDALAQWDLSVEQAFPQIEGGIFCGTAMLNRLLERKGRKVGIIVSGGMEDYLRLERAKQTYLGYSYGDRLHLVTHRHNVPLVPHDRIFGVRGRVDVFGKEAIPLYEHEVEAAVRALLAQEVDSIVVCLLFSYKNPAHEQRVREIAEAVMADRGTTKPIYLSSALYPVRGDLPRLNTTLIEAYAAEPSRESLIRARERTREAGGTFDLRVMASHGGSVSMDVSALGRTLISGPIGGVIGARYLGEQLGIPNLACSDIGGTSFDLALITEGEFAIRQEPDIARFLLSMPLVRVDSVGAGTGSYVRVNPTSTRIETGPDSAGARIGVAWPDSGVDTVTITDCSVVAGYLNPEFFLGGDIPLDRDRAIAAVREQIADPLGMDDVYAAAVGVIELFEDHLRNTLLGQILGKGSGPENYTLLSYGGGGPLHVAGYTAGLAFEDILVPAWAPGFSAFGCACGDFEYRHDHTVDLPILPTTDQAARAQIAAAVTAAWHELAEQVADEFAKSGVDRATVHFKPGVRMLYFGQLNDLEVLAAPNSLAQGADLDALCAGFEESYGSMYGNAARTPEFGYMITGVFLSGTTPVEKPVLPTEPEGDPAPPPEAYKTSRAIYWQGAWHDATILDLDRLHAGNVIDGPAVVEAPASTMLVPPDRSARLDSHRIFHLSVRASTNGRARG